MDVRLPLFLALTLVAGVVAQEPSPKFGALLPGDPVPDFAAVGVDGREVKRSDFQDQVLVVALSATNRPPSDVLENAFAGRPPGVTRLAICSGASREEFDGWVARHRGNVSYPLLWDRAGKARAESIARKVFGVTVFPATAVIGRDGRIIEVLLGYRSGDTRLEATLRWLGVELAP